MMEIEKLIHVENGKNKDKQKKNFDLVRSLSRKKLDIIKKGYAEDKILPFWANSTLLFFLLLCF